jgi:hypothetical protein
MLSKKNELKIIKTLVKSNSKCTYTKLENCYKITIEPKSNVEINIVDDSVTEGVPQIIIDFENDNAIDILTINIKSGKYHLKGEIVGQVLTNEDADIDSNQVRFRTNNKIGKVIVQQEMCTENIYSYYGNQDGFNPCTIFVTYEPKKYKNVSLKGNLDITSGKYKCDYNHKTYNLLVMIR